MQKIADIVYMNKPTDIIDIDFNEDPHVAYYTNRNALMLGASLYSFSYLTLSNTYKILNLDKFKWLINNKDIVQATPFITHHMTDCVRIVSAFENYMKGLLLSNGFVAHKIKHTGEFKPLYEKQKTEPVTLKELLNGKPMKMVDGHYIVEGITKKTIPMHYLLADGYKQKAELQDNVHQLFSEYNSERNNIHFFPKLEIKFTDKVAREMESLIKFGEGLYKQVEVMERDLGVAHYVKLNGDNWKE